MKKSEIRLKSENLHPCYTDVQKNRSTSVGSCLTIFIE